ncbi:MAG: hypothetical protein ACE5EX_10430 [Phycisphaerae bacterium]
MKSEETRPGIAGRRTAQEQWHTRVVIRRKLKVESQESKVEGRTLIGNRQSTIFNHLPEPENDKRTDPHTILEQH